MTTAARPRHLAMPVAAAPSPDQVVVLTGCAGGMDALRRILTALPPGFAAPIVVVQHRPATRSSLLATVLGRGSPLRVKDAEAGELLQPGMVYLAPADMHAVLTDERRVAFTDGKRIAHRRSSANPLFESVARAVGFGLIVVVLSGSGRNGSAALPAVKSLGATVIAQDRATSQHFGMPGAAIETGMVDYVLSIDEIAPRLLALTRTA